MLMRNGLLLRSGRGVYCQAGPTRFHYRGEKNEHEPANWNGFGPCGLLPGLLFALAILITPAQAKDEDNSGSKKLDGTWFTQVAARDCQTGSVLRTFPALNTFNRGETMIDTTTGANASQRSPGLGKWEKTGPRAYSAMSVAFLFSAAGVLDGDADAEA